MNPGQPEQPAVIRVASALFEIETADPSRRSRIVLRSVAILFGVLLLWAIFAKLDIVAVAQGRLVPQTYVKIVQPAEAGIIRELLVEEGSVVKQGDVLVRLDPTLNAADSTAVSRELALEKMQLRRIEAELGGAVLKREADDDELLFAQVEAQRVSHRQSFLDSIATETASRQRALREFDAAKEVLEKLESTLPSYQKSADAYEKLAEQKLVGSLQADERRREAQEKTQDLEAQRATASSLESTIAESDQRLLQLSSSYASDLNQQRLQSVTSINRLQQQFGKLHYQEGLLELRAPQAGVVKELATTTLGAVVQPGTVILSLVPANEPLRAEVLIENKDIGFVSVGQVVRVKLAAFQFQKYGMLEGVVRTVSADSSSSSQNVPTGATDRDRSGDFAFKALIELPQQQLRTNGLVLSLAAGMQVSAEIVQGERTVLEYLLSPVQRVMSEAAKER
ncbi:MAG TPA: HlyD family type I secretion periplasmic adaptor subunit [Steroidobacteraceae bacterium]|jgi:HlyD family secretion protein